MCGTYRSCWVLCSFVGAFALTGCAKPATSGTDNEPKGSSQVKVVSPEPDLGALIEGRVWRGLDVSLVGGRASSEYVIEVTIKNLRTSTLEFDACVASFVPSKFGQPVDGAKSLTTRSTSVQGPFFWSLKPQEEQKLTYRTNGYTTQLLGSAGEGGNLFLYLTLERNGQALAAPRKTPLPPLADCPRKGMEKDQKGIQIIFQ